MINKDAENISKYKDIKMEVRCMLNIKKKTSDSGRSWGNWYHSKPIQKTEE